MFFFGNVFANYYIYHCAKDYITVKPYSFLGIALVLFSFFACNRTIEPDNKRLGYVYFPLEIGNYVVYEVEEKNYTILDSNRVFYQLKEIVVDTFTNLSGQKQFVLERYRRNNELESWQIDSVWSALRTGSQAIKFENNIPYVKLVFPVERGSAWNGNAYNDKGENLFRISELRRSRRYGDIQLPNTVKVLMGNDSSLVTQVKREEIFAENIGMVFMERINVRFKSEPENLGKGLIESGKIEKFTIIDFGKE
ncbi:MAG: hypothetical protein OHK0045_01670 [Raineya sp.]